MRKIALLLCLLLLCSTAAAETTLNLTFTGDVTLGGEESQKNKPTSFVKYAEKEGYDYFFAHVKDLFLQDDLTVVNLEGPITDKNTQENKKKTYRFRAPTDFVKILTQSGIEACNLSNNHCPLDFGKQGYASTKAVLEQAGVGYFGAKNVYLWQKNGIKLAFFGFNSTVVNAHKAWMKDEIARLKAEEAVNAVVVTFHAGSEYSKHRTKTQEEFAHMAVDAGADLVIMHHPHVVQGMEIYKNRTICYSLGNFCFGGNKEIRALETVMAGVRLTFDDAGKYIGQQVRLYPANISGTPDYNNYQPVRVKGKAAERVMHLIQLDSDLELAPYNEEAGFALQPYLAAE